MCSYALYVKNPLDPERNITNCVRTRGAQQIADAVKTEHLSFQSPYAQIGLEGDYDAGSWGQRSQLTDEELYVEVLSICHVCCYCEDRPSPVLQYIMIVPVL